jgi:hypothetical protein
MNMAAENPNEIWFGFILYDYLKLSAYPEFPYMEFNVPRKELCEVNNYKYMITIDGDVSPWARGPTILYSESVPIVVESKRTPLYEK